MLSELAYDEDLFDQRFSENEVFYYARDKAREDERRCHYICVDATASMRGQRSVFARGLALTMIKKLLLKGEDVFFRFFDSRLYEVQSARAKRKQQTIDVPYVLSFKGEHGRNYAKVMALLANDIERLAKREKKSVVCYLITHAECHVPIEVIEDLRRVSQLFGIFMLPSSGDLDLEYLPRLHKVQIVTQAALEQREERAKRAMDIIDDAAGEAPVSRTPGARTSLPPGTPEERERAADLAAATREVELELRQARSRVTRATLALRSAIRRGAAQLLAAHRAHKRSRGRVSLEPAGDADLLPRARSHAGCRLDRALSRRLALGDVRIESPARPRACGALARRCGHRRGLLRAGRLAWARGDSA
jgi:hypothetical protein